MNLNDLEARVKGWIPSITKMPKQFKCISKTAKGMVSHARR